MPPQPWPVPEQAGALYAGYLDWLQGRGAGNHSFFVGAKNFLRRFPDPQAFAAEPLRARLAEGGNVRPLLTYLMLHGHLRPGYDYLLERKLHSVLREAPASPVGPDLARFTAAAERIGYSPRARAGMASEVAARLLIQTGRPLAAITDQDLAEFGAAIGEREARDGRDYKHYRHALYASSAVIYHLGGPASLAPKHRAVSKWSWERHLDGVGDGLRQAMVAYLERCSATLARSTVSGIASELAHFGRYLAARHPDLTSFAGLDRRRHIEPYLSEVAAAVNHRTGNPIAISSQRTRIQVIGRMLQAMAEWGWPEAPARRLIFDRDSPRLPRPLPRYLPPDADRRLAAAAFWAPLLLPIVGALAGGTEITSLWSMSAWTLLPVLLLSSPRVRIGIGDMQRVLALALLLPFVAAALSPAIAHFTANASKPAQSQQALLAAQVEREWHTITPQPLRFVGGETDLAYGVITHAVDRPHALPP